MLKSVGMGRRGDGVRRGEEVSGSKNRNRKSLRLGSSQFIAPLFSLHFFVFSDAIWVFVLAFNKTNQKKNKKMAKCFLAFAFFSRSREFSGFVKSPQSQPWKEIIFCLDGVLFGIFISLAKVLITYAIIMAKKKNSNFASKMTAGFKIILKKREKKN